MRLKTHFARSGHIYQHEVKYIIINYLSNKFNVFNYSLHPDFTIKVLGTCTQVLLKVLVLVLKYFRKSSTCTCTCTRHFFEYLYLYSSTFVQYSPQAWFTAYGYWYHLILPSMCSQPMVTGTVSY